MEERCISECSLGANKVIVKWSNTYQEYTVRFYWNGVLDLDKTFHSKNLVEITDKAARILSESTVIGGC